MRSVFSTILGCVVFVFLLITIFSATNVVKEDKGNDYTGRVSYVCIEGVEYIIDDYQGLIGPHYKVDGSFYLCGGE